MRGLGWRRRLSSRRAVKREAWTSSTKSRCTLGGSVEARSSRRVAAADAGSWASRGAKRRGSGGAASGESVNRGRRLASGGCRRPTMSPSRWAAAATEVR
ncbi:hypothetical protein CLOP_g11486 [Closterium sp. NIES-67]|nr:hypothetical protein CLOP_g11486 [Closterium sp. NIES-67]